MGIKTSSVFCCSPEQHSINFNVSTNSSIKPLFDDEQILYSKSDLSPSLVSEKLDVTIRPYSNCIHLDPKEIIEWPCTIELNAPSYHRQGVDIIFVIEVSTNITSLWLNSVKKTIWYSLTQLTKYDRVGIVGFSNTGVKLCPLTSASKHNSRKIYDSIRNIQGSGGSNVLDGVCMGLNILSNRRMSNVVATVLLFCKPDVDPSKAREILTNHGISTNFSINTFGLGDHSADFLYNLSNESGGNYYNIPHPMTLCQAFGNCLGEVLAIYAENVKINAEAFSNPTPYNIERLYLPQNYVISGKPLEICLAINFMPSSFIFKNSNSIKVLKIQLKYKIISSGEDVKSEIIIELPIYSYNRLDITIEFDESVLLNFYRSKLIDLLYEILFEDSDRAGKLLENFCMSIKFDYNLCWFSDIIEEIKSYCDLLKIGWNSPLKSRIICSAQGYDKKSLFYIPSFQSSLQKEHQVSCKNFYNQCKAI